jgi:iron complex transport system ATP-binding protein
MPVISASKLSVSLSGQPIIKEVDFSIGEGSFTGILGPNGSGKTTVLRALAGLIPYSGSLSVEGKAVRSWSARALAMRLAFVRQSHSIPFDFKVDELVLLGRSPHKNLLSSYDLSDAQLVRNALKLVDMSGFSSRSYSSLSGGEQQRVFLAQALVQEADILLLDEPTTYLDVHHQFEFLQHVRSLVDSGKTVIGAFHDLEMAARFCDHLIVFSDGTVAADGPPTEVLDSELLARVFRMNATVYLSENAALRIHFETALSS